MITFQLLENKRKIGVCLSSLVSLLYNLYIQWYNKPSGIWQTFKKKKNPLGWLQSPQAWNIQIYYTLAQEGLTGNLATWKKTSTKHTGFEKEMNLKRKQKNERNAEKYLQILNIHYIQTRGLPGCHHGDADGVGVRLTARAQRSRASYMQWSFLAGGNNFFFFFFLGGYLGVKMPIDSSVGHHKKLQSYTWSIVTWVSSFRSVGRNPPNSKKLTKKTK